MSSCEFESPSPKFLYTIRIIKAKLHQSKSNPTISLKCGEHEWKSAPTHRSSSWQLTHSFFSPVVLPINLTLYQKFLVLRTETLGSAEIPTETLLKGKGISWYRLEHENKEAGNILISFLIEKQTEEVEKEAVKISEIGVERLETRFFTMQIKKRLVKLKNETKDCNLRMENLISRVTPVATEESDDEEISQELEKKIMRVRLEREYIESQIRLVESDISNVELARQAKQRQKAKSEDTQGKVEYRRASEYDLNEELSQIEEVKKNLYEKTKALIQRSEEVKALKKELEAEKETLRNELEDLGVGRHLYYNS